MKHIKYEQTIRLLRSRYFLLTAEQNLNEKIETETKYPGLSSGKPEDRSAASSVSSENICEHLFSLPELRARLERIRTEIRCIDRCLDRMPKEEATLLRVLFSGGPDEKTPTEAAGVMNCEISTVYRIRERALKRFALSYDGSGPDHISSGSRL